MGQSNIPRVSLRSLMEAGAHYGHRKRFWHPSFKRYLYGERNGLHIINLESTKGALEQSALFCMSVARNNGKILFVCTKRAGADLVREEAARCDMPYVTNRWLGGLMCNFETVRQSIRKMEQLEEQTVVDKLRQMTKKEGLRLLATLDRLRDNLSGVRNLNDLPDALLVVDAGHHRIAVREANKIGIPVVAVVDSNCSSEGVDYIIPGNDDSTRAISIYLHTLTDSIIAGKRAQEKPVAAKREISPAHTSKQCP